MARRVVPEPACRCPGPLRAPARAGFLTTLVSGDSGSPLFLGRLGDTDRESVVAGVATAQTRNPTGLALGIYTRVGPYRALLDAAVEASGEKLRWYATPPGNTLTSKDERR